VPDSQYTLPGLHSLPDLHRRNYAQETERLIPESPKLMHLIARNVDHIPRPHLYLIVTQ
jgi:hypothetical protein